MFSINRSKETRSRRALRQAVEALEGRVLLAYTLDPSFSGDGIAEGQGTRGFAVQSDNKVVAIANTSDSPGIRRVNANGSLDTSFGAGGKVVTPFAVNDVVISGGKIIVGGGDFQVARYNANGTLDTTFGGGDGIGEAPTAHGSQLNDLALAPDGKLVLIGAGSEFPDANDISQDRAYDIVARFNPDGTVDTSFSSDGVYEEVVPDMHYGGLQFGGVQSNGKIVVAGLSVFSSIDGAHLNMWRLNADGSSDSSFNGSRWDNVALRDLDIASDDKILVAVDAHIDRFTANGAIDAAFNTNGFGLSDADGGIYGVQPLAGGGTLVSG